MRTLLEYESQIFLDAFHEDGLLVMAKGLGIDRVFLNFLKVYSDPANLVLVLNTNAKEEEYFTEQLEKENLKPLPRTITNEVGANERQKVYLQGGVLFLTSRILVVDLLTERVPVEHISGILVYKAHRIVESCQEAFILRLYRQKNKTGFIKAFSDSPYSFTTGYSHVERTMKNLFVRNLYLWPRFHASIVANLEHHKVDVVEIQVQLTSATLACQTAMLDLINACIQELKRCTTAIEAEEVTVENAIGKAFDKTIRFQLDPVWHQLSAKTRQLVSDLKTLRLILRHMTQYDSVTFYSMVNSVKTNEKVFGQNTGWLFLDAADSLFVNAKERVFGPEKSKISDKEKTEEEPVLEECPKWKALRDILKEIKTENKKLDPEDEAGAVLIAAEDDRTCSQLKEVLCDGSRSMMIRLYNKYLAQKGQNLEDEAKKTRQEKIAKMKSTKRHKTKATELTLTQMVGETNKESHTENGNSVEKETSASSVDAYYGIVEEPVTILHPLHGGTDPNGLSKTLQEVQPRYVVLYDADMQFVRELEVYRASRPGNPLRVYFMMYTGSVEEQRYLTTLRMEKEAFEYLIREKANMVIPEEREGKLEDDPNLSRDTTPANATVNTRKGGAPQVPTQQKVIVDMREFGSELPSLIHRRGIEIEPITLEIGDYILSPDICVERKSVSDLIGSLNNGRLYNQCISMCRYYKKPVLLIEFDANKSFSLQMKQSSEVSIQDVTSRLALLTLHFPKLRILWCQSPYATAELFEELKAGKPEPHAATALAVGSSEEGLDWSDKYSHRPQDFLLKMPGVNVKNYRLIMNKVESLSTLCDCSLEQLTEIMGSEPHAKQLYNFIHSKPKASTDQAVKPGKSDFKRGFKRKR
ncbi:DNA repair endonuclease XPF-like isoform X2 [Ostrea edulis]|uniref:DNA repair endonuclease XPF-like isoform X2 n=1 Tax=Ostrea edulis TaxID=37623 RepID=UPI0024AF61EA|nr:DNA repair endonuclease XPF-like isoform X2 [Ostrea edulis]